MTAPVHLDTSFLVRALVRGSPEDTRLRPWLAEHIPVHVSAIAWTEFLCGPLTPAQLQLATQIVGPCLAFEAGHAAQAAALFNASGRRRGTLADCMIAAVALSAGAPLATANPDDFRPLEPSGLHLA